jgi:hypothetical protein
MVVENMPLDNPELKPNTCLIVDLSDPSNTTFAGRENNNVLEIESYTTVPVPPKTDCKYV